VSTEFSLFLPLGFRHIADLRSADHILFVAALTAAYAPREWVRIAWLVTAFTVGHTVSLALATFNIVHVPARAVEIAIALTIIVTALVAIHDQHRASAAPPAFANRYAAAGVFGLIHGLGFSNYLRALLGGESDLLVPLFAFNVGLELGQLLIVATVLAAGVVVERSLKWPRRDWVLVLSGATAGVGVTMLITRVLGGGA
jgi:hydrogenase/urease accessory protein HupE